MVTTRKDSCGSSEGYPAIENIPEDIDEHLKKEIFDLVERYKTK